MNEPAENEPSDSGEVDIPVELPDSTAEAAQQITETLSETILGVALAFVAHLPLIIAGSIVLALTWSIVWVFRRSSHRILAHSELRGSLRDLIERLLVLALWGLGFMLAAMIIFPGLTPTRALGGLGLASVAIGFAFKDIFENFFAGILILWRFPFEHGDFIECGDIMGRVVDVTIRMTQIERPSGELVVVPNGFLFKNPVEVLTHDRVRRCTIMTGIAYDENVTESVKVIQGAAEGCDSVDDQRGVEVFPQAFGASSIDIEVAWWCDPTPLGIRKSRGEVVTSIKGALDDAGIEIPFPYRTLTFKEPLRMAGSEDSQDGASQE